MKPGSLGAHHRHHRDRRQFARLTRNFFARFFENDLLSAHADLRATLSQVLGLLGAAGLFAPLLLLFMMGFDQAGTRSWNVRLIFVYFSALVIGVLTVLEWDALLLDRRDQTILMPLPVRPRTIFAAKFTALMLFLAIFSADINAGSILLVPMTASSLPELLHYAVAHAVSVFAASAFTFLSLVSVEGILIAVLGPKWFSWTSTGIQVLAIMLLIAALLFFPGIWETMCRWKQENNAVVHFLPPLWYLGIYETLQGTRDPEFWLLARIGICALAAITVIAVTAYAAAYGRFTRTALERAVDAPRVPLGRAGVVRSAGRSLLRRLIRDPVQRAMFCFLIWTMIRSSKHRLVMAVYVGTGLAMVLEEIAAVSWHRAEVWEPMQQVAIRSLPLVISFFLLSGMRFIFNVPAELSANWVFQLTEHSDKRVYLSAVRRCMLLLIVAPVGTIALLAYSFLLGPQMAIVHAAYCSLLSLVVLEALLWRLDKIPFTCSYVPGRTPVIPLLIGYWLAFIAYTHAMALLEFSMLRSRWRALTCLALILAVWWAMVLYRRRSQAQSIAFVFHQAPDPLICTLDLG